MIDGVTIRTEPRPGDLGRITQLHGEVYTHEYGWDWTFEAYVADGLASFAKQFDPTRERLWLAETDGALIGSVAITRQDSGTAVLRWFVLHPDTRGKGLGKKLLAEAIDFARRSDYGRITLRTEHRLTAAAGLYRNAGFKSTELLPSRPMWGDDIVEEGYELVLRD